MPVALAEHEAELRGLVIGSTASGYVWKDSAPDWWASQDVESHDTQRPGGGVKAGRDVDGGLTVTASLAILGADVDDLALKIDALRLAWKRVDDDSADLPLRTRFLGQERLRYGRPRRCAINADLAHKGAVSVATIQFLATDHLRYADLEQALGSPADSPGAGITPPFTPPVTLPAGTLGGLTAVNGGNTDAPWTARIDGPTTPSAAPFLQHEDTDEFIDFAGGGGLELAAGEWVDLDSRHRTVVMNGTADRRINVLSTSRWFSLAPGDNPIRFAGSGTLTFTWRDTWE